MSTNSFATSLELVIGGNSCEREATVRYEYSPAGGDGWHEPHYSEGATVYEVEVEYIGPGMKVQRMDILPLLTKDCISALEADCCQHEADEREYRKSEAADARRESQWEVM